jgi:multiple sugar transport system ATP-binding protein
MADVKYDGASRIYPGSPPVRAVDTLNLDIPDGEFLVLVGPSGSGKSTALRMLAGLEDINEGRIIIGGRDVTNVPPKNRDIAMVFQSYALYPHMTVAENMGFALKLRGVNKTEIASKVREAAGLLDLEKYLDRKPKALSGGQRQRVAMGRAIVREPSVFLMDEPLSNLDAKLRVETRANIAELQARLGTTTVYVTHDQVEAMTMGNRVAVLKDGILNQVDTPRTLYDKPVNVFVAGFMGSPSMNLLTVPLVDNGANLGGSTFELPRSVMAEAAAAGLKEVTFGVRPENITLSSQGIPVTIDLVEELGADAFVHGHTPDGSRMVIRADARIHPSPGSVVHALPTDAEHCHVFDSNTGIRFKSSDAVPADASIAAAAAAIDLNKV